MLKRFDSGGFTDTHPMFCRIQPIKKDGEFKEMDAFTNICYPPIIHHIKFEENQTPMFPSFSCFLLLGCWRFPLRKRLLNNALFIWFHILRNVHHVLLYVDFMWTPWNISYFSCCWFELALRGRATMWWASCNLLQNLVIEKWWKATIDFPITLL